MNKMTPVLISYFFEKHWLVLLMWNLFRQRVQGNSQWNFLLKKDMIKILDSFFVNALKKNWRVYASEFDVKVFEEVLFKNLQNKIKNHSLSEQHFSQMAENWKKKQDFWELITSAFFSIRTAHYGQIFEVMFKSSEKVKQGNLLHSFYSQIFDDLMTLKLYPEQTIKKMLAFYMQFTMRHDFWGGMPIYLILLCFGLMMSYFSQIILSVQVSAQALVGQGLSIFFLLTVLVGLVSTFSLKNLLTYTHNLFVIDMNIISSGKEYENEPDVMEENDISTDEGRTDNISGIKTLYKQLIAEVVEISLPAQMQRHARRSRAPAPLVADIAPVSYLPISTPDVNFTASQAPEEPEDFLRHIDSSLFLRGAISDIPFRRTDNPHADPDLTNNQQPEKETFYIRDENNQLQQIFRFGNGTFYVANLREDIICTPKQRDDMTRALQDGRVLSRSRVGKRSGLKIYSSIDNSTGKTADAVMKLDDTRVPCSAAKRKVYNNQDKVIVNGALVYLPEAPVLKCNFKGAFAR